MLKKFFITLLMLSVVAVGIVYYYRHEIVQYSADAIIREKLPSYMTVGEIEFNLQKNILELRNLSIDNPRGYKNKFLAEIGAITCRYRMKGKTILDGIEVTNIIAEEPVITIERSPRGRINVNEMGSVMGVGESNEKVKVKKEKREGAQRGSRAVDMSISDIVELTDTVNIRNGKIIFSDRSMSGYPYRLTIEDMDGELVIDLSDDYSSVLSVASRGVGFINGDMAQQVGWDVSLDPTARDLTMTGRYNVRNVDITLFEPYYDMYSPIVIDEGIFSGNLIFNFDNGSVGSTNTLYLNGLRFREKRHAIMAQYWQIGLSEIIRYLQSTSGEIVFDFKIKGDMNNPQFLLGPKVKGALQNLVIDKIVSIFTEEPEVQKSGEENQGAQEKPREKSDVEKIVGILEGLF